MTLAKKISTGLAVVCLSLGAISGAGNPAFADDGDSDFIAVYIAPDGSELVYKPEKNNETEISLRNFDPQGEFSGPPWAACGIKDPSDKLVHQYTAGSTPMGPEFLRKPNLRCGNEKFGYRHIKLEHKDDWKALANRVGGDWKDFASFAIQSSLETPQKACLGDANDIRYIGMVEIRRSNGLSGEKYYPRVPVGKDTNNIITAFPQTVSAGCP